MLGAVQVGLVAACVVLFVPMGMAGWHLSRNKMLFFSGALFITLAVGVHLTPYFPSLSHFLSSSASSFQSPLSCFSLLPRITFKRPLFTTYNHNSHSNTTTFLWSWEESTPVLACEFQKLGRSDASDLLNGSWVVVAGDSQARFVALSLLNLVMDSEDAESVRGNLFKRHSDCQIVIGEIGMKLDFIWAPYASNLTDLVTEFKQSRKYPDVLVMSSGLWHMLRVTNASDFGVSLRNLRDSVVSLLPISPELGTDGPLAGSISIRSPHLFWLGMPVLINSMLNTEEKREKMNSSMRSDYDRELYQSKVLRQSGGPLLLLDIQTLSRNCGAQCTLDGMHYDGAIYDAAVHVMLNALLIESQQKL